MTLDKAIERYKNNAEHERTHGNLRGCLEFRQLAEWLNELNQLREEDAISRQGGNRSESETEKMTKETYQLARRLQHDLTVLRGIKFEQDKHYCVSFQCSNGTTESFWCNQLQNDFREFIMREIEKANKMFEDLSPNASAEKVGEWTRELMRNEYGGCIGAKMICSECGQDNGHDEKMKFCPNCGAKMNV